MQDYKLFSNLHETWKLYSQKVDFNIKLGKTYLVNT